MNEPKPKPQTPPSPKAPPSPGPLRPLREAPGRIPPVPTPKIDPPEPWPRRKGG